MPSHKKSVHAKGKRFKVPFLHGTLCLFVGSGTQFKSQSFKPLCSSFSVTALVAAQAPLGVKEKTEETLFKRQP